MRTNIVFISVFVPTIATVGTWDEGWGGLARTAEDCVFMFKAGRSEEAGEGSEIYEVNL